MLWFLPSNFQYKNALTCPVFLSIMLAVTFLIFPLFFQTHKATKGRVPSVQAPGLAFQHKWEIKIFHRGPIYLCSSETPKFNIFWAELKAFIISLCVCMCAYILYFEYLEIIYNYNSRIHFDILYLFKMHPWISVYSWSLDIKASVVCFKETQSRFTKMGIECSRWLIYPIADKNSLEVMDGHFSSLRSGSGHVNLSNWQK